MSHQAAILITTAAAIASTFCTSARATVVEVPANMSTPTSSGVILQVGELLNVEATGSASYGFEGTCGCFPTTFPDGSRFNGTIDLGPKPDPFAVLPSAPIGALIGEVGISGPWFFVGESYSAPVDRSGEFFLLYNDAVGTYSDNSGSYFATVSTTAVSEPTSLMLLGIGLLGIAILGLVSRFHAARMSWGLFTRGMFRAPSQIAVIAGCLLLASNSANAVLLVAANPATGVPPSVPDCPPFALHAQAPLPS